MIVPENLTDKSILITGGAGFIGSNIVEFLIKQGIKVRVLDDLSTGSQNNIKAFEGLTNFEFLKGDIRDKDTCMKACLGMNIVLHQAALGSVPRSIANPIATNSVNIDGFVNMLYAAKENNISRFVYASSSSVYGDDPTMPKKEERTGNLLSPYAVTKHANEKYAAVFSKVYGIETVGLRYFNVFGPKQDPHGPYAAVIPLFIDACINGKAPKIFGDGSTTRDFTYVENVIKANLLAATASLPAASNIINIACGETTSLLDLFKMIAAETGFKGSPNHDKERMGDIKNSWADISQAQQILAFEPSITVKEGLIKTVKWYKEALSK